MKRVVDKMIRANVSGLTWFHEVASNLRRNELYRHGSVSPALNVSVLVSLTDFLCFLLFQEYVEQCCIQIDNMLKASIGAYCGDDSVTDGFVTTDGTPRPDEFTPPPMSGKLHELETAVTPTDVRDVRF